MDKLCQISIFHSLLVQWYLTWNTPWHPWSTRPLVPPGTILAWWTLCCQSGDCECQRKSQPLSWGPTAWLSDGGFDGLYELNKRAAHIYFLYTFTFQLIFFYAAYKAHSEGLYVCKFWSQYSTVNRTTLLPLHDLRFERHILPDVIHVGLLHCLLLLAQMVLRPGRTESRI